MTTRFLPRTSPRWCGIMPTLWNMSPKRISSINRGRFKLCETKHLELLKLRKMEDILHQLIWRISHVMESFINDRWLFGISEPSTVSQTNYFTAPATNKKVMIWLSNARHFFKVDWKTTPRIVLSASAALTTDAQVKNFRLVFGEAGGRKMQTKMCKEPVFKGNGSFTQWWNWRIFVFGIWSWKSHGMKVSSLSLWWLENNQKLKDVGFSDFIISKHQPPPKKKTRKKTPQFTSLKFLEYTT